MTTALSLEEARAAAERSLCSECGALAPLRFESTAPDVSGVVRHAFIGRCPFCQGTLRVVFLVPVTNSPEAPPPAAGAPAESGKSWVVQHFEEAERLARESLAAAMCEAEAGGKEKFDLARFERLLNRGPQARREQEHLNNYYIMRPECRTLQAYVNDLLAGEPWDQLAVAPTTLPSPVDGKITVGASPGHVGNDDTLRTFTVTADLSSVDLKFGTTIQTWIKSTDRPTRSEALAALDPIVGKELRRRGDEGGAAYSINNLEIAPPEADAPAVLRAPPVGRVDLRLVALTERRHPATNELAYQVFKTSTDGDSIANVFVCADRIELDDSQLHTSPTHGAAVEAHTPTYRAVIRRGEPGWPDAALTWIRARFGDSVASEVHRVINEADAFRE